MDRTYWYKQTADKPLFADLLWSRPENKAHAGKLLVIGGNSHGFAAPAKAYELAQKAGIGAVYVLLPEAIQKIVGGFFETAEFAPSTPSGSFARQALASLLDASARADGVLVAGDLGRNSETAIVLEQFTSKYNGQLNLTKDAVDYFTQQPTPLLSRHNTLIVLSLAQLQKFATRAGFTPAFTFDMDLLHLVDTLHSFTEKFPLNIIVKHLDTIAVAVGGQVSTTKLTKDVDIWRVEAAVWASVWWLQNPNKSFEALTTAVYFNFANQSS